MSRPRAYYMRHGALIIGRAPNRQLDVSEQGLVFRCSSAAPRWRKARAILRKISQVMVACGCLSSAQPAATMTPQANGDTHGKARPEDCAVEQPAAPACARPRDSAIRHRPAVPLGPVPRCAGVFLSTAEPDSGRHPDPVRAVQEAPLADARSFVLAAAPDAC